MSEVDSILNNWYGERPEDSENARDRIRHLYAPLRKIESDLAAERARADKETKNKKEFERDWLDACDQLDAMKKDRDRLRAAIEHIEGKLWEAAATCDVLAVTSKLNMAPLAASFRDHAAFLRAALEAK